MTIKTKYVSQPKLMEKAAGALIEKLGFSQASQFWVSLGCGRKDYTEIRKKIFKGENVGSLYKKIKSAT